MIIADPPKALLFDADHVVQRAAPYQQRLKNAFGLNPDDADACAKELYAAEATTLTGNRTVLDAMGPIIEKWGRGKVTPKAFFAEWNDIRVDKPVLALISDLRAQGYYCALASNQHAERAHYMVDSLHIDLYFDHLFFSFELGFAKPDPQFFRAISDETRWPPQAHLFIDDNADNVAGAASIGMQAIQYEMPVEGSGEVKFKALLAAYGLTTGKS